MSAANPYHLLGLPVDADNETITRRGQELADLADSDAERDRYVRAVRELIGDPVTRRLHQIREVPGAAYRDEQWSDFDRRHRRNPAAAGKPAGGAGLRAADFDLVAIIDGLLDDLLEAPDVDLAAGIRNAPVKPRPAPPPPEVADVLFG